MIVVADTTPINYLILIEEIDVLPKLYGRVILPRAVSEELMRSRAPVKVQEWIKQPPAWLEVLSPTGGVDAKLAKLDAGERDAIALAEELSADQLIVDELLGRREAERRSLPVIGTIGVLREAAEMGLLNLRSAFERYLNACSKPAFMYHRQFLQACSMTSRRFSPYSSKLFGSRHHP